jgi:hypothetical protein
MLRVLLGLVVVAHGLVTFGIWAAPVTDKAPFNPKPLLAAWRHQDPRGRLGGGRGGRVRGHRGRVPRPARLVGRCRSRGRGGRGPADGPVLQPLGVSRNSDQRGDPVRGRPSTPAKIRAGPEATQVRYGTIAPQAGRSR